MIDVISPNVKFIYNKLINKLNDVFEFKHAEIHDRGVVVISCDHGFNNSVSIKNSIMDTFDYYNEHGHVYPVNESGIKGTDDKVGSHRFCTMNREFARALDRIIRISNSMPSQLEKLAYGRVSSYFRFMKYLPGGQHFPHYDSDFETELWATKYSLVMYFSDNETGELAFVNDNRGSDLANAKADFTFQAEEKDIWLKIKPAAGKIVLFPHDLCHTVLPLAEYENPRLMVRGDILFYKNEDIQ